jgi:hypothetical protein
MTNLKPVDVAIVGGRWSGLAIAKEIDDTQRTQPGRVGEKVAA